jgi:hypothetical protein
MSSTSSITWRPSPRQHAVRGVDRTRGLPIPVALPLALLLTVVIASTIAWLVGRWT